MTLDEWWEQAEPRERDALIAEKVMGWTVDPIYRMYTGSGVRHAVGDNLETRFNPSTKIAHAWEVVEKLQPDGWSITIQQFAPISSLWDCELYRRSKRASCGCCRIKEEYEVCAATAPEAIALAALRALDVEVPE